MNTKSVLIIIFLSFLPTFYVIGQNLEEEVERVKINNVDSKEKITYNYEKYKLTFQEELARLETELNSYSKDTSSKESINLAKYFNQIENSKLDLSDLSIIVCGDSKSELLVNFLSHISRITEKLLPQKLYDSDYNIGSRLFIKYSGDHYSYGGGKSKFYYLSHILLEYDSLQYFISAYGERNVENYDIQRNAKFTIYKAAESDTTVISKLTYSKLSYLPENIRFNELIERYLMGLGFKIEFHPLSGYGIFAISEKSINKLKNIELVQIPSFPDLISNTYLLEEFNSEIVRREEQEKEKRDTIEYDYERYKRTFEEEMRKLEKKQR